MADQSPAIAHLRISALGSYGGTDMSATIAMVMAELPDRPHMPELPDRGAPAHMVGRTGSLLEGLSLDLQPSGWRLSAAPDAAARTARALFRRDLDDLEEQTQGYQGPIQVAVAGPWTLAAMIELGRGGPVLSDRGARRDLTASLAAGVSELMTEVRRRMPLMDWHLQVDEPMLLAVQRGRVPTSSGFGRLRSVGDSELAAALRTVCQPFPGATLHSCAQEFSPALARRADVASVSLDATTASPGDLESWGEWVADGGTLLLGVLDASLAAPESADQVGTRARRIIDAWGLGSETVRQRVLLTPSCGLAGWTLAQGCAGLRALRAAARQVDDVLSER